MAVPYLLLQGSIAEADLWRTMVLFKQRTGFWFAQNATSYRWQKDVYDHTVRSEEDLHAQVRYIANNPVRTDLVKQWDEYPFTGAIGFDLNAILMSTM